ncbi:hypothetical protein C9374_004013 [Naegleria lovaniensis]|uniref:Major facilitator superfamily (MFS) profile domain-containing protein n=1 Tax=Naegleria lovaniensis TaxID=51637 RepID=A0AA88H6P4_NAELO|nr:uncharacterized protein C9374_004013 [Naegleria lovaniensis]KAG2394249.1 hypothetical protein C9374_004013 [Naegleria lovaniensis]
MPRLSTSSSSSPSSSSRMLWSIPPIFDCFTRHPKLLLLFLTIVEMLMFFDRGAIASVLPSIKEHWTLSGKQEGIIGSAFIITFSIGSTLFAFLANYVRVNLIMAFGLFVWTVSAILSGLWGSVSHGVDQQWGYYMLVLSRALIGIGEASFVPLSVTLIDDIATKEYKTTYMSFFMLGVPLGVAFGYSIASYIVNISNWTYCFYMESLFGLFFGCLLLFIPLSSVKTKHSKKTDENASEFEKHNTSLEIDDEENYQVDIIKVEKIETTTPHEQHGSDTIHPSTHFHSEMDDLSDDGEETNSEFSLLHKNGDSHDDDAEEILLHEPIVEEELRLHNETTTQSSSSSSRLQHIKRESDKNRYRVFSFCSAMKYLFCNPVYCFSTLGSCGYNFVAGAIQFYAPSYVLHKIRQSDSAITIASDSANFANIGFSVVMLLASIIGTMLGGFIVDRFGGSNGMRGATRSLLFCGIFLLMGFPWVIPVFIFNVNIYVLLILFGISCVFLFCSTSPFQCSVVNSVEYKNLRNYGVSWQIFLFHLFGDFPSAFIFGLIQDSFSIDVAMSSVWIILIPSSFIFIAGYFVSYFWLQRRHDKMKLQFITKKKVELDLESLDNSEEAKDDDSDSTAAKTTRHEAPPASSHNSSFEHHASSTKPPTTRARTNSMDEKSKKQ